ncbi:hypothetical protein, partial [Bacillus cereus]|uniref:hypothetical protein n=1 Tax=Bacillus cereus TaxID=1396 RepID=UPI001A7E98D3
RRGALCLVGRSEATEHSSHWNWTIKKVEAACSEQEGVGSPDEEALFASQEGVKRPTVLATGTGL